MRLARRGVTMLLVALVGIGAVGLAAVTDNPGVVFEMEIRDHTSSAEPAKMTMAVEGRDLKIERSAVGEQPAGSTIFRGDRREMFIVNHADRSYFLLDEAGMKELAEATKGMDAMLANVPPEQRAMVERMMRGRGLGGAAAAPKRELRRTGERATHSGYATEQYEVLENGRRKWEFWVTPWSSLEGADEMRTAVEAMAEFGKVLTDAAAQSPMLSSMAGAGAGEYQFLRQLNGYPVVTRTFSDGGQLELETTLRSVTRRTMSPGDFEVPDGYRRQSIGR